MNFAPPGYNGGDDGEDPTPDPKPADDYAPSFSDYFNSTYIYYVSIGNMENYSNASSYTFFKDKKTELEAGGSYYITLMPRFPNGTYPMYWCVWVDFNGNKIFEDNERVLAQYMNSANYFYRMFKVPANAVKGETRVRVSAKWGGYPKPDEHFTYGEVEDYTAVITQPSSPNQIQSLTQTQTQTQIPILTLTPTPTLIQVLTARLPQAITRQLTSVR